MAATILAPSNSSPPFRLPPKLLTTMIPSSTIPPSSTTNTNTTPVSHGFSHTPTYHHQPQPKPPTFVPSPQPTALDALATLATSTLQPNSSSCSDSLTMPPPPPRRMRSASNPEGMEKWDSLSSRSSRCHFVLPTSILEEELVMANVACREHEEERLRNAGKLTVFRVNPQQQQQQQQPDETTTSPTTVISSSPPDEPDSAPSSNSFSTASSSCEGDSCLEDEANLEPEELLRRARSRLLEDLATESNVQKTVLPLPHALDKYKSLYNKNGRIGIYTPLERAAIISKFNSKRGRRVWNKKIRYNCRKNLADRRMRVKGRFVKRAVEQRKTSGKGSVVVKVEEGGDVVMPDVNDPEAGFRPTEDQPYRRVRRHTIT